MVKSLGGIATLPCQAVIPTVRLTMPSYLLSQEVAFHLCAKMKLINANDKYAIFNGSS
jgi:hypothetical protein